MRLVTSIYTIEDIENMHDYIDYALVAVPHLSVYYKDIDVKKAVDLLNKYKKNIILNINRIMHPSDIEKVISVYKEYLNTNILFYISDLGALNEAIKLGIKNKNDKHYDEYKKLINSCIKKHFLPERKEIFKCNY